jgi:nucleoside-diphosphate-sugar epimerase
MDQVPANELEGCNVLVHLAAHTGNVPYDTLANCLQWNLIAVLDLFEKARLAGIQRFIVAGSCFEYGKSGERYTEIPTDAPLEPTNSYAASKAAASIALLQWAEEHKLSLEILRVFHVFGEGEPEKRFWPTLRRAALAGEDFPMTAGEQIRDFLPVEDAAKAFLSRAVCSYVPSSLSTVFNLTSGKPCTIRAFAEHWWKYWGARGKLLQGKVPYRDGEVMRYAAGPDILDITNKNPSY